MTRVRFHLSRRRRARIESLIVHLVDLLDAADRDLDLEPETDEDDGAEASAQPTVTPDSARPTTPLPVRALRILPVVLT